MFETNNYAAIMARMLKRAPTSVNTDEGSFLYTAFGPTAIELAMLYAGMDAYLKEAFADTASRERLIQRAAEIGVQPHAATAAVWVVTLEPAEMTLEQGARFNCGAQNLYVSGKTLNGDYELTCETPGTVGNGIKGELVPIKYISGFKKMQLKELEQAGTDEEETEAFRERYLTYIRTPAASGNAADYYNWAMTVDGVGAAKVFPMQDGPGTVTVVITDGNKKAASESLVTEVKSYIEQRRPVGASVTVKSGAEKAISVSARVVLKAGYTLSGVQSAFKKAFTEYLENGAFTASYVGYAWTGNLLIDTAGVEDYADLKIEGGTGNIKLTAEEIAVCGSVALEVQNDPE